MIAVREAGPADAPALIALRGRLWDDAGTAESLAEARRLPGYRAWLAWDGGNAVGFAEATLRSYADALPVGLPAPYLEGLFVRRRWRRAGVGRLLVAAVEAWARAHGSAWLASDALVSNRRSRRVHRALGFAETGRIVTFAKRLDPPAG